VFAKKNELEKYCGCFLVAAAVLDGESFGTPKDRETAMRTQTEEKTLRTNSK
jgi:hypothetical protein